MLAFAIFVIGTWTGFVLGLVIAGRGKLVESMRQHAAVEGFNHGLDGLSQRA